MDKKLYQCGQDGQVIFFLPWMGSSLGEKLFECWGRRDNCRGIFEETEVDWPTLATSGNKIPRSMSSSLVARTDIFLSKPTKCQWYIRYLSVWKLKTI